MPIKNKIENLNQPVNIGPDEEVSAADRAENAKNILYSESQNKNQVKKILGKSVSAIASKLKFKRLLILLLAFPIFLALVILLLNLKNNHVQTPGLPAPAPKLTPTPSEEIIINPSAYASDSAVLEIENEINLFEKKLLETNLYETPLNPPVLDMGVRF